MLQFWIVIGVGVGVALAIAAGAFLILRHGKMRENARQQAMDAFASRRAALANEFLAAASATGKPRGLRWTRCEIGEHALYAVDRGNGELLAMTPVTISFEAVEGGGMEEVEAVSNLRSATAVFIHRNGDWTTDGRVVFNLEPEEALQRFAESLEPVTPSVPLV